MTKAEKLQISNLTLNWLSQQVTEIQFYLDKIRKSEDLSSDDYLYDESDLDNLEIRLNELNARTEFEAKNLKKIKKTF
jgi:uncharacterized coiled-coil protein SlyX